MYLSLSRQVRFKTAIAKSSDDHCDNEDDGDIYIMMKCLCVCLSRKMITSSWESPVTT